MIQVRLSFVYVMACLLLGLSVYGSLQAVRYPVCMTDAATPAKTKPDPGLCGVCVHARHIESPHGSVFYLCELSFEDLRFAKYPRLPVLTCDGFEKKP